MGVGRGVDVLTAALESGHEVAESEAVRLLRSPLCSARAVALLAGAPWARASRRVAPLIVRHPECPRGPALDLLGGLPWTALLEVATDPRTPPPVRRQAERRLGGRLREMALGERVSLARRAPRGVVGILVTDPEPRCTAALLHNPRFTEGDAVRVVASNSNPQCIRIVLGHERWGRVRGVLVAAARSRRLPDAVALGVLPKLGRSDLRSLARGGDASATVREAARRLLTGRRPR